MPNLILPLLFFLSQPLFSLSHPIFYFLPPSFITSITTQAKNITLNSQEHITQTSQSSLSSPPRIDEDKQGNQGRRVNLYNNDHLSKGYAYKDKQSNDIGINTKLNDLTQPKEVINILYHETSKQGNKHNTQAWMNDALGIGERDNLTPLVGAAVRAAISAGSWVAKKATTKLAQNTAKKEVKESGKKVAEKEIKNHKKDKDRSSNSVVIESNFYKKGRPANPESTKTIPNKDYAKSIDNIRQGKNVSSEYPSYPGNVYEMPNGQRFGIRANTQSRGKTETIDNMTKGSREKWKKGD